MGTDAFAMAPFLGPVRRMVTAKYPFAVLFHRIMSKPELPALWRPGVSSAPVSSNGISCEMRNGRSVPALGFLANEILWDG